MVIRSEKTNGMPVMGLLLCLFGGYLAGCLGMNLYWKYTSRAAASAFYISVYAGSVRTVQTGEMFWHILRRDIGLLSLVFFAGLLPWGRIVIGGMLIVTGMLLGILTSGVLLTEGMYWWIQALLWMLPCFLCSGSIIGREMYLAWQGTYYLAGYKGKWTRQLLAYGGHIVVVFFITAILSRAESSILSAIHRFL